MFTGLIESVGEIERARDTPAGRELLVKCGFEDLEEGESIAVNGACLTVREHGEGWFTVAAIATSLSRTTIGEWNAGRRVNLERALRAGDRLGGHLVQGHVDGVGRVERTAWRDDAMLVDICVPAEVDALLVPLGSIAVDGVSLTVNALPSGGMAQVSLIETTRLVTTLGSIAAGDRVHLEADVIGKFVQRMVAPYAAARVLGD